MKPLNASSFTLFWLWRASKDNKNSSNMHVWKLKTSLFFPLIYKTLVWNIFQDKYDLSNNIQRSQALFYPCFCALYVCEISFVHLRYDMETWDSSAPLSEVSASEESVWWSSAEVFSLIESTSGDFPCSPKSGRLKLV